MRCSCGPPLCAPHEPLRVFERGLRIARDRGRAAQAGENPALQKPPGGGRGRVGFLPQPAAHGEQIVTGDDDRPVAQAAGIHGVGVIANVDEGRRGAEFRPQAPGEEDELVEIAEPFPDERAREAEPSEERLGADQLRGHAGGGESFQHHGAKTLHALLSIGRVVTDQQNHWGGWVRRSHRGDGGRRANNAPRLGARAGPRSARPRPGRFRPGCLPSERRG